MTLLLVRHVFESGVHRKGLVGHSVHHIPLLFAHLLELVKIGKAVKGLPTVHKNGCEGNGDK